MDQASTYKFYEQLHLQNIPFSSNISSLARYAQYSRNMVILQCRRDRLIFSVTAIFIDSLLLA
jgi:hypothetical protein